ncbi:hypothetical protein SKAU_G00346100 [Synaphobranchus kaupii]|uniref:Uncharacterized protein n=1 Tax=Synaphobranchus kaupii TaxID=118154 RepID=A0A9Q1IHH9_SYNKA|nr:hypothetical protein SKAU_G00346100 [Synaphobranchus kaupii]
MGQIERELSGSLPTQRHSELISRPVVRLLCILPGCRGNDKEIVTKRGGQRNGGLNERWIRARAKARPALPRQATAGNAGCRNLSRPASLTLPNRLSVRRIQQLKVILECGQQLLTSAAHSISRATTE